MYDTEILRFIDETGADKENVAIVLEENQRKATNFYAEASTYLLLLQYQQNCTSQWIMMHFTILYLPT